MLYAPQRGEVLTPLIYHHMTPYGRFVLDMTTRLPLRMTAQRPVCSVTLHFMTASDTVGLFFRQQIIA
jgi:hypothetical protein